jgi:hypothetical protein
MSETPFFKTRMGQRYYERTMPELVEQISRLNELLEQLVRQLDPTGEEDR